MQHERSTSLSVELEQRFRYELPVRDLIQAISSHTDEYSIHRRYTRTSYPVVSRVKSEIFAKDASNLVAWFRQEGKHIPV